MWRYKLLLLLFTGFVFAQDDFIIFPHTLHVVDEEIECETCHEDIETATSLSERYLPSMDICSDCHDIDEEDGCGVCHANEDDPLGYEDSQPTSGMTFSHVFHINAYSNDCLNCHDYFAEENSKNPPTTWKEADCRTCHTSNKPKNHYVGWLPIHGMEMLSFGNENCSTCHSESYCNQCHVNQQVEPRVHLNDYLLNHGFDARAGLTDCGTCHDIISDCYSCHNQNDAMPMDHNLPNWAGKFLSNGGEHGAAALDAPMTCKSCHIPENEATCMRCHS